MEDVKLTIKTEDGMRVSIESFDDGAWLHLANRSSTMHTSLTREEAQRLLEGLRAILETQPA